MRKATLARAIKESAIEIRSYEGKRKRASRYLVIKGRVRKTDFFKVFAAAELAKGTALDIPVGSGSSKFKVQGSKLAAAQP